ncbi:MotA/TolQ/ExbB proton channel family protein [Rasiella sp. SM2506]|uniref:MotA/TolQ/ExbB proton channel family protein n=1 Tax=Rasiella sp. SM2506 TaxID=3423914 RepID=UPI003D7BC4D3
MRLLNQGGPVMYIILALLLLSIFFTVKAFLSKSKDETHSKKMIGLVVDTSLLSLVIGCLGSLLGIIDLFDMVEALGETRPDLFSARLKESLLTITFGLLAFVLGRLGILVYKWSLKSEVA